MLTAATSSGTTSLYGASIKKLPLNGAAAMGPVHVLPSTIVV